MLRLIYRASANTPTAIDSAANDADVATAGAASEFCVGCALFSSVDEVPEPVLGALPLPFPLPLDPLPLVELELPPVVGVLLVGGVVVAVALGAGEDDDRVLFGGGIGVVLVKGVEDSGDVVGE